MQSSFNRKRRIVATSTPRVDETYDLRGLNMIAPDQVMPKGESPFTINSRAYAKDAEDKRVAIRSRKGSQYLSQPIGEAQNVSNTATSTGEVEFSATKWLMQKFTPDADGALTKLELEIKKNGPANGHVIVEIYTDNGGGLGELVAHSSILASGITDSYQWLNSKFMDAPELENGTDYWKVLRVQTYGTGVYVLNLTAGSDARYSEDGFMTTTAVGGTFRFKTHLATAGEILGFTRRYPQNKVNRTYFAFKAGGTTKLYEIADTGVATEIDADLSPSSEVFRSAQVDDKLIYVDGDNRAKWYDGTDVKEISGITDEQTLVIVFKNRLMFVPKNDPTRVNFSALYSFESYPSVNFFYVPNPKSPDHIAGWRVFQDNLLIFTHETKHVVFGSDISSFTRKEAVGTKGAVSDEAIAVDRNHAYFMADDGMIYRWNGATDDMISGKVEPELASIQDRKKVRLHIYRNQLRVYYAKKPSQIADRMLIYDIETQQWFMDTGRSIIGSLEWYLNDNQLIEFSSRTGQMFLGEQGNSDMGKAIDFKYWTAYNAYGSGAAKDRIKRFRPIVRPSDSRYYLMVGKATDLNDNSAVMRPWLVDGGGAVWGNFNWGDGTKWGGGTQMVDNAAPMSGRAKHTQYRFECNEVETPVELYGYIALIKSGRSR
jgi:hypothetical protein